MTTKEFIVETRKVDRRISSLLQHKLRVVMKCYTITGFTLNPDLTFTFQKSHMINGIRLNDSKTHSGSYEVRPHDEEKSVLRISIH